MVGGGGAQPARRRGADEPLHTRGDPDREQPRAQRADDKRGQGVQRQRWGRALPANRKESRYTPLPLYAHTATPLSLHNGWLSAPCSQRTRISRWAAPLSRRSECCSSRARKWASPSATSPWRGRCSSPGRRTGRTGALCRSNLRHPSHSHACLLPRFRFCAELVAAILQQGGLLYAATPKHPLPCLSQATPPRHRSRESNPGAATPHSLYKLYCKKAAATANPYVLRSMAARQAGYTQLSACVERPLVASCRRSSGRQNSPPRASFRLQSGGATQGAQPIRLSLKSLGARE